VVSYARKIGTIKQALRSGNSITDPFNWFRRIL